jgi:hypothetical protein
LETNPPDYYLPFFLRNRQFNRFVLWITVAIFLLILSTRFHFWEPFLQFPHFWGGVVGLLLWNLFPTGLFGIAILFLTTLSFLTPAWSQIREFTDKKTIR